MSANTLLFRLEGPLQSWGDHGSKFVVRRTADAPTKSGVMGMLCAALAIARGEARPWLKRLNVLQMGVRIDRPGIRWWDWHTVGAKMQLRIAEGERKSKPGAMLTRREYLADASFLVALNGQADLIGELHQAILHPKWPLYLGRKSCPPSVPLLGRHDEPDVGAFASLEEAFKSVRWRPRFAGDPVPDHVVCLLDWRPGRLGDCAPHDAEVWYDVAQSFDVPAHTARFVLRKTLSVGAEGEEKDVATGGPRQQHTPAPPRQRADYQNGEYRRRRDERLEADHHLCIFCKTPLTKWNRTVQHVTYRRAGGNEHPDDLRSLCRLCHDAVTMIEYGVGMGLDRINPEDPSWRDRIIAKRDEIVAFRSLETRSRRLQPEEVE